LISPLFFKVAKFLIDRKKMEKNKPQNHLQYEKNIHMHYKKYQTDGGIIVAAITFFYEENTNTQTMLQSPVVICMIVVRTGLTKLKHDMSSCDD
jgi:hypothetical protein